MTLIAAILFSAVSNTNAFTPCTSGFAFRTQLDAVKIYYDTQTGNTETCAGYIAAAAGLEAESIGMSHILLLNIACSSSCCVDVSVYWTMEDSFENSSVGNFPPHPQSKNSFVPPSHTPFAPSPLP